MKKRIFGNKLGTVLTVILCLLAAVFLWLYVKLTESGDYQSLYLLNTLANSIRP